MTARPLLATAADLIGQADFISIGITPRGVTVAFHDPAERREAAERAGVTDWKLDQPTAVVTQSCYVGSGTGLVHVDLYSKADGVDWKRYHDAQGGAA